MHVNKWVPSPGCNLDWDIDEIMTRESCDVRCDMTTVCTMCDATNYDDWGFVLDGSYVGDMNMDHDCHEYARDSTIAEAWEITLQRKREDEHYEDVLNSIRDLGFVRPVTAWRHSEGYLMFGDGHHRLAAAIDLGFPTVPIKVYSGFAVAEDSGEWWASEEILLDLRAA